MPEENTYRRVSDLDPRIEMSFSSFCVIRWIPKELCDLFVEFFKTYFEINFKDDTHEMAEKLLQKMEYSDIILYWNMFLKNLKNSIITKSSE